MLHWPLIGVLVLLYLPLFGQDLLDTTVTLQEVVVRSNQIRGDLIGPATTSLKSDLVAVSTMRLDEVMQLANVFVKTTGPGGVATSSIRGGSASHSMLLWNGLPLTDPMLGQVDLALTPISLFENAGVQRGGQSADWGSGAISGLITLDNSVTFDEPLELTAGLMVGSFSHYSSNVRFGLGRPNFKVISRWAATHHDNNYPWQGSNGAQHKLSNATYHNLQGLQSLHWRKVPIVDFGLV